MRGSWDRGWLLWAIGLCGLSAVVTLASASSSSGSAKKSKIVSTLLNAPWSQTPLDMELGEFLASEPHYASGFWPLVDFWVAERVDLARMTDEAAYQQSLAFASRFLSRTQLNLLKFSLSLRTSSPKVEMFQQIAADRGVPKLNCPYVLEFNGKLTCQIDELDVQNLDADKNPRLFSVDHHYGKSQSKLPAIILYGNPRNEAFASPHNALKSLAEKGQIDYIYRPFIHERPAQSLRLSGYGVELQIKSTEYKAHDDRKYQSDGDGENSDSEEEKNDSLDGINFQTLNDRHPADKEKLAEFKQHLIDEKSDMAPMKVWQLQDLSLQAAERVLNSPKDKQLKTLMDLAQNFPSQARSLSKTSVSKELKKENKKNQEMFMMNMNVAPTDAALFINGMYFDMEYVDIFSILDTLKSEGRVLDGLGRLGLTDEQARKMISQDFTAANHSYGIDVRDSAVNWINDIEKDKLYKGWSESVSELLRPTFPGMLRSIRKNFFNVVIMCDPSSKEARGLLKLLESFYVHRAPTRIGIVFAVNDDPSATGKTDAGVALLSAFNYISAAKEPYDALAFMTDVFNKMGDADDLDVKLIQDQFLESYGSDVKLDDVFDEDSEYDVGRQLAKDFVNRSGFKDLPQVLMNGVPMESKYMSGEEFEEGLMMSIMKTTNELQRAVYRNQLKDSDDCLDYLMMQPNIMPRLNDRVLKESSNYIEMTGDILNQMDMESFLPLSKAGMAATLGDHLTYLTPKDDAKKLHVLTSWVAGDFETPQGRDIVRGAISHLKSSSLMRIGLIHNTKKPGLISKILKAAFETLDNKAAKHLISKVVKEDTVRKLTEGKKQLKDYDIPGADMSALSKAIESIEDSDFDIHRVFCERALDLEPGQNLVVSNGKLIGPLTESEVFAEDDFNLMEKFAMSQYGEKMVNNYYSFMDTKAPKVSDQAMKIIGLLMTRSQSKSRTTISFAGNKHTTIQIEPNMPDLPAFDITAIFDPLSVGSQKITPILLALKDVLNTKITVFLNCVEKHSEMPQKSYFRMVLEPEVQFGAEGKLLAGPMARFSNLPEEPVLTMHYHIPDNWLIEPVKSVYDMDNIKLANAEGNIHSEYELEYLLLEGHCFEAYTGNPPRGLQLVLGTDNEAVVMDTIVMANLGYLQLKSSPGRWLLNLREGRSSELYDIVSHEGTETAIGNDGPIQVLIDSFQSKIVKLRVQKKPDKRNEELLEADAGSEEGQGGLWNSISNTFSSAGSTVAKSEEGDEEVLNIFCLASGHLYERLLKIMMLSTIQHTKAPVKFWVLKNYLSPSIKEFLPEYAKRYGFQYEYVQYKWPRWLNQQKEKQRIIWGYKILFLDVMFPLDVKKILFVDTDQIVRADLTELRDIDLKGAPYGYTPFCDSNKDMEGFRFWKSGYWKNHLAGRPYHISALYVVDLVKFRKIAAGDRLRGQYQALSQDPNSLSNLDQDLPNNMIHQVPIFSLPQEWLWCETWCDQTSKTKAKSIDLCNNPLTKESKLDAARRIVTEWSHYDDEMTQLTEDIQREQKANRTSTSSSSSSTLSHESKHTEL
ncbi:UDP-glucose:glycoprotein glucosyltransferase 1-like [Tigriopus californicus]|uniref:UDP-glucose:glycoprotein glucosyltransferase 1-like n=1 Tax=Tigriopus californicus TaxID=6832 RepID=UPI0027D9D2B5|nr:UDP-glucose:glycoprotein glucosyltransferase 1-like [Tigriopus californicus]